MGLMEIDEIGGRLRAGQWVPDADFDLYLPDSERQVSGRYWTQVGVATQVSSWLKACGVSTVLDIGSGAGKFCVVGALSSDIAFTGIEQRAHLVDTARSLAMDFEVSARVTFVHGDLDAVDCRAFDALYFYNPFGENVMPWCDRLDASVETSRSRFFKDITRAEHLLRRMPVASHVATYNGYGGRVPDNFELVEVKAVGVNMLRLWRKARPYEDGGCWSELEDSTVLRTAEELERSRG